MSRPIEVAAMRRAIELAARALGCVSPNPPVGCVVLDVAGDVAGEGFTAPPGGPHAEVVALRAARQRARGGTAVTTLEPCDHYGRTPPCSRALIEAGVARVVYALDDPVAGHGGGAATMRAAGIDVEAGLLEPEAARGNEAWLTAVRLGRPFVTWKFAASLDGRVAASDGSSRWVTSAESRADGHRLRAECDAVIVGSGTMRIDDPHLAVRDAPVCRQPLRVVVDTNAQTPVTARVLDGAAPTLIAVAHDADSSHLDGRAEVVRLPRAAEGLQLNALLRVLYERDVRSALVEGGPTLSGSFLSAGLIDRVVGYLAPVLIGGGGATALTGPGAPTIAAARRLRLDEVTRLGPDVRLVARPL
ncbi:MAG TPA: bifunctional diaminohydroxyphosphoribosylaminopyrimidine deaminase/5-amino-6-(5-phosphoribosylamino)uracil reductase RibD [Candidatus Dormibacteraeota bacterium]|nr:bifunctional diaminohydroxyphosphoribosylaminopyrimidine deaminase/5-amino-6-(5-phosphoribosylamino)uracil reductase RibD [Candidatus Dormibacteraeota bacterium]